MAGGYFFYCNTVQFATNLNFYLPEVVQQRAYGVLGNIIGQTLFQR